MTKTNPSVLDVLDAVYHALEALRVLTHGTLPGEVQKATDVYYAKITEMRDLITALRSEATRGG
jgi:hypothetical protein